MVVTGCGSGPHCCPSVISLLCAVCPLAKLLLFSNSRGSGPGLHARVTIQGNIKMQHSFHNHPTILLCHQCQEVCGCRLIEKQLLAALAVRLSCRRRNSECWRSGPGSQSYFPYTFSNLFSFSASTCKLLKFLDFK